MKPLAVVLAFAAAFILGFSVKGQLFPPRTIVVEKEVAPQAPSYIAQWAKAFCSGENLQYIVDHMADSPDLETLTQIVSQRQHACTVTRYVGAVHSDPTHTVFVYAIGWEGLTGEEWWLFTWDTTAFQVVDIQ